MNKFLSILVFSFLLACSVPNDRVVRQEFLAERPNASIEFLGVGEGDSDHAYYHIQYRIPSDSRVLEEIWLYQKQSNGAWVCINKSEPKEFRKY